MTAKRSEQQRMSQPRHPLPVFPKRTEVRVYMGAGWAKGTVTESSRDRCTVWLPHLRRSTHCRDARNIQRT